MPFYYKSLSCVIKRTLSTAPNIFWFTINILSSEVQHGLDFLKNSRCFYEFRWNIVSIRIIQWNHFWGIIMDPCFWPAFDNRLQQIQCKLWNFLRFNRLLVLRDLLFKTNIVVSYQTFSDFIDFWFSGHCCSKLTLKAPNKNCSRWHFIFLLLSCEENKAWFFMWILCLAVDSLKHQVLFSLKNTEKTFMNVICGSRDWRFKD